MNTYEVKTGDIYHQVEASSMEIDNGVLIFYDHYTDNEKSGGTRILANPSVKKAFNEWNYVEKS